MLDVEQLKYYKDPQMRAWKSFKTTPGKNCYTLRCYARADYELLRNSATLTRRELLCSRCLNIRQRALGLVEIVHSEKE